LNHGTVSGAVSVPGHVSNAHSFDGIGDGIGDFVEVPNHPSLPIREFSATFWINPTAWNAADQSDVFTKWNEGGQRAFLIGHHSDGDLYFAAGVPDCNSNQVVKEFQGTAPLLGQLTFVAWVVNGSDGTVTVYKDNGVQAGNTNFTPGICSASIAALTIGRGNSGDRRFNGLIDDVIPNLFISGVIKRWEGES